MVQIEAIQFYASVLSATVIALSSFGGLLLFTHRTMSTTRKRAFDVINTYHTNREFHEALGRYKTAIRKIDLEHLKKLEKISVAAEGIDDQQSDYLSDIYFIVDIYNYWAMLVYQKDVHRGTFRKYLAALIVDEVEEGRKAIDAIDPGKIEFRYIHWLHHWWLRSKKSSDFSLH